MKSEVIFKPPPPLGNRVKFGGRGGGFNILALEKPTYQVSEALIPCINLSGLLVDYDFHQHVASDVGVDQQYLPAASNKTQHSLDYISNWTKENLMKLNQAKCNYMVFSRSKSQFATRLMIDDQAIERVSVSKLLGIWISDDMSWSRNTQEMCKKAYSRLGMLTKLKYVGVPTEDLLDIYILFIRSVTEYCAVVFHSSLTLRQSQKIEKKSENKPEGHTWRYVC